MGGSLRGVHYQESVKHLRMFLIFVCLRFDEFLRSV